MCADRTGLRLSFTMVGVEGVALVPWRHVCFSWAEGEIDASHLLTYCCSETFTYRRGMIPIRKTAYLTYTPRAIGFPYIYMYISCGQREACSYFRWSNKMNNGRDCCCRGVPVYTCLSLPPACQGKGDNNSCGRRFVFFLMHDIFRTSIYRIPGMNYHYRRIVGTSSEYDMSVPYVCSCCLWPHHV